MELVFIFCIPLLHNIIQVKCLTLYEYASVKVISLKKKMTPHLTPCSELGASQFVWILGLWYMDTCLGVRKLT